MTRRRKVGVYLAIGFLVAFVVWTVLVCFVDRAPIGPQGSVVGMSALNQAIHRATGVHMALYVLTDWLGLVPIGTCLCFAILGLLQWIRRKRILLVDRSIFVLGGFYLSVMAVFVFFETVVINYRPVLIDGILEASYPSSTTMLVMCVMPTAMMQIRERIKARWMRCALYIAISSFLGFMVLARLISGVHWTTDIIGGALISVSLVSAYQALAVD